MSDADAVLNADALLTLVEEEHDAFDLILTLGCLGCPWRRTVSGFIEASVVGQAHQVLHAQCSPWVPTITLREGVHAASTADIPPVELENHYYAQDHTHPQAELSHN